MAVIKIVPMPGAKGDKGDEGATGAQGLQGPIGATGPAGADALWSYNGAWQSNATYAEGDLVTHDGQLYYATGVTTLGVTPDLDSNFDLIAAKGESADIGIHEHLANVFPNGLVVEGYIGDPEVNPAGTMALSVQGGGYTAMMDFVAHSAVLNGDLQVTNLNGTRNTTIDTPVTINNDLSVDGFSKTPGAVADALKVKGITNDGPGNLYIGASDTIWITANNGEYVDRPYGPEDRQIAALGDIKAIFESGTWDPKFAELSGITYSNSEQYEKGTYYCVGDLVFFDLTVHLGYVSDWGNPGSSTYNNFKFNLPFEMPLSGLGVAGQSGPATRIPFLGQILENYTNPTDPATWSMFPVFGLSNIDTVNVYSTMGSMNQSLQPVTPIWPSNFTESQGGSNSSFSMSGVYRKQ